MLPAPEKHNNDEGNDIVNKVDDVEEDGDDDVCDGHQGGWQRN